MNIMPTLLWTNPNPSSNFVGNIQVDGLSAYKYVIIGLKGHKTYKNMDSFIIKFECGSTFANCSWTLTRDTDLYSRYLQNGSALDTIKFGDCYVYNFTNRTNTVLNEYLIPMHIYGTNYLF